MKTRSTLVLQAIDIKLSGDELVRLDDVSRLAPHYPAYMMRRERGQAIEDIIANLS